MAFPFLTGFYSKDLILELSFVPKNFTRSIGYILSLIAAFLSAIYSVRLIILSFIIKPNFPYSIIRQISEPVIKMFIPLFILAIGAAFFGFLFKDTFLGIGSTIYFNSIFTHPSNIALFDGPLGAETSFKFLPLLTLLILFTIIPFSTSFFTKFINKFKLVLYYFSSLLFSSLNLEGFGFGFGFVFKIIIGIDIHYSNSVFE